MISHDTIIEILEHLSGAWECTHINEDSTWVELSNAETNERVRLWKVSYEDKIEIKGMTPRDPRPNDKSYRSNENWPIPYNMQMPQAYVSAHRGAKAIASAIKSKILVPAYRQIIEKCEVEITNWITSHNKGRAIYNRLAHISDRFTSLSGDKGLQLGKYTRKAYITSEYVNVELHCLTPDQAEDILAVVASWK